MTVLAISALLAVGFWAMGQTRPASERTAVPNMTLAPAQSQRAA